MRPSALLACALALCLNFVAGAARADETRLESCSDAGGRPVRVESDPALPLLVQGNSAARLLKINPERLPELSATARQFFYARACAALSLPGEADTTPERAKRADCLAVAALRASGLLAAPAALQALQEELVFSAAAWEQLPGPPRTFDLARCPANGVVRLPRSTPPSAAQEAWNACERSCGDRLYACQKRAGNAASEACLAAHGQCEAACPRP